MLRIKHLCKAYDDKIVLNDLNLSIETGEVFGFVGPNGAGKTTTMKIMAGLLPADSGRICIDGLEECKRMEERKQHFGYVPDFFGIYDNFKVIEYLEFYGTAYGLSDRKSRKLSYQLLERVNLLKYAEDYVDVLSRGMKQRLGIARSLIHNPRILILDEPSAGLDPRSRADLKTIIKDLKDEGKTFMISSHVLTELSEICSSIGILDQGRLVLQGSIQEILLQVDISNPLMIQVLGNPESAIYVLKQNKQIKTIAVEGQMIMAKFIGSAEQESELLTQLIKHKVCVVSYRREYSNLESLFLKITDKKESKYEN